MTAAVAKPSATPANAFAPLSALRLARKGAGDYYQALLRSDDETIRFGAWCQMLALEAVPVERYDEVLALCHHPAIKQRAFDFFRNRLAIDLAEAVAATAADDPDPARSAGMKAEIENDYVGAQRSALAQFHVSGDVRDLLRTAHLADRAGGWREALPWYVRAVAVAPLDLSAAGELFRLLAEANEFESVKALASTLAAAGLHPYANGVFLAAAKLAEGNPKVALQMLAALRQPEPARGVRDVRAYALRLTGEAQDKAGDYRASFQSYSEMNRLERTPSIDPKSTMATAKRLGGLQVPPLPPVRADVVMMLGFARSGTTLLETVLDAHADIEAIEESATWDAAVAFIERSYRSGDAAGVDRTILFGKAREVYYRELERQRRKAAVRLVVDKYPMRTIYARLLESMMKDQRYIFCIRHPFDVVLSCFRQRFNANAAMEAFREWPTAVELYDFTMTQWFDVHRLDDPQVHYLRYERLVESFEPAMRGTLDFLGMGWDEGMLDFAEEAHGKSALTPSYQKIRKGLALGVQTYWRNYGFLFEGKPGAPLRKWAEFFGYPTA